MISSPIIIKELLEELKMKSEFMFENGEKLKIDVRTLEL